MSRDDRNCAGKGRTARLKARLAADTLNSMIAERIPELKNLSLEEKLALAGELWDEVIASADSLPPRSDHVRILEERLAEYRRNPQDVSTWEEVKQRILSSR